MKSLKNKLFNINFDGETKPLFKNQKRLVELIFKQKDSNYTNEDNEVKAKASVQIFLSNCINGKRKLSDNFKCYLETVLDDRLHKNSSKYIIKDDILKSFDFVYNSEKANLKDKSSKKSGSKSSFANNVSQITGKTRNSSNLHQAIFEVFLNRSENAKTILNFTPYPSENSGTNTGNKVLQFISDCIGLYGNIDNPKEVSYFFPNNNAHRTSIEFWQNLYSYNSNLGIDNLEQKIIEANSNGLLNVYSVDDMAVNFPVTCFDYNGFHEFGYTNNLVEDLLAVMPLNDNVFKWWKNSINEIFIERKNYEISFIEAQNVFSVNTFLSRELGSQKMEIA